MSNYITRLQQLELEARALTDIVNEAEDKAQSGKASAFRAERSQRIDELIAALPALIDVAAAAVILREHISVWREEMPGSIHAGARRLDEALERLESPTAGT